MKNEIPVFQSQKDTYPGLPCSICTPRYSGKRFQFHRDGNIGRGGQFPLTYGDRLGL